VNAAIIHRISGDSSVIANLRGVAAPGTKAAAATFSAKEGGDNHARSQACRRIGAGLLIILILLLGALAIAAAPCSLGCSSIP